MPKRVMPFGVVSQEGAGAGSVVKKPRFGKRKGGSLTVRLPRQLPFKMISTMRYATTVRLDASIGTAATHVFNAASIYDPDVTAVGHQPYSHDEFAAIYAHYRVLSSKITVRGAANGSSSTGNNILGIRVDPEATAITNIDLVREKLNSRYTVISGDSLGMVTHYYDSKKAFPVNVSQLNATFGANPTSDTYFHVFVSSLNSTVDPVSVDLCVEIEYKVLMWDLKAMPQS
jgi:hypothetical protein